jgi:hypothetical protein
MLGTTKGKRWIRKIVSIFLPDRRFNIGCGRAPAPARQSPEQECEQASDETLVQGLVGKWYVTIVIF